MAQSTFALTMLFLMCSYLEADCWGFERLDPSFSRVRDRSYDNPDVVHDLSSCAGCYDDDVSGELIEFKTEVHTWNVLEFIVIQIRTWLSFL